MKQLVGLFDKEIESVFKNNGKFIAKPLYSIFVQSQMFIKEYSASKKANPRHVELYQALLPNYLQLFFSYANNGGHWTSWFVGRSETGPCSD